MGVGAPPDAAQFFTAEFPRLVGALDLYVGDRAVAQELAQEALLRAFQRWEHVRTLESPGGWTWRVAVNLANSHLRRRVVERRVRQRLSSSPVLPAADDEHDDAPEVRAAVAALPPKQRAAVVLRYFYDFSAVQTATAMSSSPEAVRALTSRAAKQLRDALGPLVDPPAEVRRDA